MTDETGHTHRRDSAPAVATRDPLVSPLVDVVVVSYNSRADLRNCLAPLAPQPDLAVVVVDNASTDGSLETVADLPLKTLPLERNGGFAYGCNRGWTEGSAPYVLFLNPDAQIGASAIGELVETVRGSATVGATAPRIVDAEGTLDFSLRRFPRLRSTYAQAFFLHRLFPHAPWTDELVRNRREYERPHSVDWVSGACLLVRRDVLERLGGWDEGFFMYGEDIDLCRRIHDAGYEIRYVPTATVIHTGGASAARSALLPTLAASRIRYASRHAPRVYALLERIGIAAGAITHLALGRGGKGTRAGHVRALAVALGLGRRSLT